MELRGAAVTEFIGAPLEAHGDTIKAASPITYVSRRSAPLLLLHSRTDPVVPFAQSAEIEELYRRASAAVSLKEINAPATHAFWNETRYFPETMKQAVEFFRLNLLRVN
jgi:acetyl esterase/lipase